MTPSFAIAAALMRVCAAFERDETPARLIHGLRFVEGPTLEFKDLIGAENEIAGRPDGERLGFGKPHGELFKIAAGHFALQRVLVDIGLFGAEGYPGVREDRRADGAAGGKNESGSGHWFWRADNLVRIAAAVSSTDLRVTSIIGQRCLA
jgi:hypothetical protein